MFDYPETMTLDELQAPSNYYKCMEKVWDQIDDLVVGGHQIKSKAKEYLVPRLYESQTEYNLRVKKFTYANILGMAIQEQVSKLNLGSLVVSHDGDDDFWGNFLSNVDGKDTHDSDFISLVFRTLLKFSEVFVRVDNPVTSEDVVIQAQADQLGIRSFISLIDPRTVLSYDDGSTNNDPWIKIRTYKEVQTRQSSDKFYEATWVFIDSEQVAQYKAIGKFLNNKFVYSDDQGLPRAVNLTTRVLHNFGSFPVVRFDVKEDLWLVNQAYLLQLEHLNMHNSKYDTSVMIGYVQRHYKPVINNKPDLDLDYTYTASEPEKPKIVSGNPYILEVDSFNFSEAQGTSITVVSVELDKLENKIRDVVGLSGLSASKGAVEQSGVSKMFDTVVQEILLREYGKILTQQFTKVLKLVAKGSNVADSVYATGLNNFNLNSLVELAEIAVLIEPLESKIAPTALKIFYSYLQSLLATNSDPKQEAEIQKETEEIWRNIDLSEDSLLPSGDLQ
jgi:hypothetical protein